MPTRALGRRVREAHVPVRALERDAKSARRAWRRCRNYGARPADSAASTAVRRRTVNSRPARPELRRRRVPPCREPAWRHAAPREGRRGRAQAPHPRSARALDRSAASARQAQGGSVRSKSVASPGGDRQIDLYVSSSIVSRTLRLISEGSSFIANATAGRVRFPNVLYPPGREWFLFSAGPRCSGGCIGQRSNRVITVPGAGLQSCRQP